MTLEEAISSASQGIPRRQHARLQEVRTAVMIGWREGGNSARLSRAQMLAIGLEGCGDNSCLVSPPLGMATNGGCRCDSHQLKRAIQILKAQLAIAAEPGHSASWPSNEGEEH